MNSLKGVEHHSSEAVAIVKKIDDLASELISAITQDDGLRKYHFDNAIAEKAKRVDASIQKYNKIYAEYTALSDELESAKKRFNQVNSEYQEVMENNQLLVSKMESGVEKEVAFGDESEMASGIRKRLAVCRELTGMYFDFNAANNDVSGYVAIKGDDHHQSGLVPFWFKKYDPEISSRLWKTIGEALHDDNQ